MTHRLQSTKEQLLWCPANCQTIFMKLIPCNLLLKISFVDARADYETAKLYLVVRPVNISCMLYVVKSRCPCGSHSPL